MIPLPDLLVLYSVIVLLIIASFMTLRNYNAYGVGVPLGLAYQGCIYLGIRLGEAITGTTLGTNGFLGVYQVATWLLALVSLSLAAISVMIRTRCLQRAASFLKHSTGMQ